MRVAYNKYSRRFDFSAPPTFVPVLLACIACWVVSYLYSVGYPVYGEVSATPLWNTICQTLPGKEFTYIIGMALMFGGAFLLHRANYVLVLIREKTMLPFLFYVLFISTNPDFFPLKSTSVGVFCLILAIYQLFTTYHDPEAREKAYSAALLIGIGSLLWVHLLWFLPLFWLGMYNFRSLTSRTFIASLLGGDGILVPVGVVCLATGFHAVQRPFLDAFQGAPLGDGRNSVAGLDQYHGDCPVDSCRFPEYCHARYGGFASLPSVSLVPDCDVRMGVQPLFPL